MSFKKVAFAILVSFALTASSAIADDKAGEDKERREYFLSNCYNTINPPRGNTYNSNMLMMVACKNLRGDDHVGEDKLNKRMQELAGAMRALREKEGK